MDKSGTLEEELLAQLGALWRLWGADAPGQRHISAGGLLDSARTLSEARAALRAYERHLGDLECAGWELREPVMSDYGPLMCTSTECP